MKKVYSNNIAMDPSGFVLLSDYVPHVIQIFSDSENAVDRVALTIENINQWGAQWIVFPNAVYGSAAWDLYD